MKRSPFKTTSRLSYRIALYSGFLIAVAAAAFFYFFYSNAVGNAILLGVGSGILSIGVIYFVSYGLQYRRMKKLHQIIRNIARKEFENYDEISSESHDELDYILQQSVRTSKTIHREIQRLNRIENYRKEFIGDISHELKTPIFAVQGFIETLLNGAIKDDEVNRKFLKKAMRNVKRLTYLTKDLMDISKLETGELKSEVQDIYLQNIIKDVADSLQYKAEEESVTLGTKNVDREILVRVDRNQIKQVLINLTENAIKYNKPGGSVTIGTEPYGKDSGKILVFVEDTGIGIDQENIERVTERFFRVDKSRSREKGGTGLGLAIVKHIMEVHGEKFTIESELDEGSKFSFTLTKAYQAV